MGKCSTQNRRGLWARKIYPDETWAQTYNNALPELSRREVLVEYTSHPDARFHLPGGKTVAVARLEEKGKSGRIKAVAPATQSVTLRVVEKGTGKPVAAKLHVHGEAGEYLAPLDRHRVPNSGWFQDYSVDFAHQGVHWCTYMPGETKIALPFGRVCIEVSKGFEVRPARKVARVGRRTREIVVELDKVLPWRAKGWVSADTHVHFLSPQSALLEGAGEGVNVVNLLASQWGEMMTNVGDFDGKSTFGSREAGGDAEFLVRVGTENRQHVLGHYSDKPEIITAHSTPVMVELQGSPFLAAADAVTILDQIEGALAYLDTVGTRAETKAYRRMRMVLTAAHRTLHNRMHQMGCYHKHTPKDDHPEHH